jgi:hypothetical protein
MTINSVQLLFLTNKYIYILNKNNFIQIIKWYIFNVTQRNIFYPYSPQPLHPVHRFPWQPMWPLRSKASVSVFLITNFSENYYDYGQLAYPSLSAMMSLYLSYVKDGHDVKHGPESVHFTLNSRVFQYYIFFCSRDFGYFRQSSHGQAWYHKCPDESTDRM